MYCKCRFLRPSHARRPALKCLLKGWLTKLLCVQHEDDLSSGCSNNLPMACRENYGSQSGMWKAVTLTKEYDIVKTSSKYHTPLCEWAKWRVAICVIALDFPLVHKNSMQRSTTVTMETRASRITEKRAIHASMMRLSCLLSVGRMQQYSFTERMFEEKLYHFNQTPSVAF